MILSSFVQTLRRLAQNREAARKSRLRKKVSSLAMALFADSCDINSIHITWDWFGNVINSPYVVIQNCLTRSSYISIFFAKIDKKIDILPWYSCNFCPFFAKIEKKKWNIQNIYILLYIVSDITVCLFSCCPHNKCCNCQLKSRKSWFSDFSLYICHIMSWSVTLSMCIGLHRWVIVYINTT